jgi:hypothetical protein
VLASTISVVQDMESPILREAYGMMTDQAGVLVREIPAASHEYEVLQVDDIITTIDGVQVCLACVSSYLLVRQGVNQSSNPSIVLRCGLH